MANLIEQTVAAIRGRLAELVGEQQQLQKALAALEGLLGSERGRAAAAPSYSHQRRRLARRASPRAQARSTAPRRRGPSRADQLLELVSGQPGITVAEAAEQLGTSRNTLYNLTARLQREGRLRKDGRGFYPAAGAPQRASRGRAARSSR